ncbi:hypothetical protein ACU4GI_33295 [Cupriavidus basilensis]
MRTTVKEYAEQCGITENAARRTLDKMLAMRGGYKATDIEMVHRRVRGYSGKLMPTRVTTYNINACANQK